MALMAGNNLFGGALTKKLPKPVDEVYTRAQKPFQTPNPNISPEAGASASAGTEQGTRTPTQFQKPEMGFGKGEKLKGSLSGSPEVATSENPLGTSGNETLPYMPTSMQTGLPTSAATDTMGSKLLESLQGAKTTQKEEIANRMGALGYTGGQAASQIQKADRDFGLGISQGLGDFNINRLQQAANINRDFLQLELQRELGLGQLELGSEELDANIAMRLSELAQYADTQTRAEISDLMEKYFGTGAA